MNRTWDLAKGRTISVLTHHKKGVRALLGHPEEYTFASAAADNIKKWKLPEAQFIANLSGTFFCSHSFEPRISFFVCSIVVLFCFVERQC
jgi:WD40 repeat protein